MTSRVAKICLFILKCLLPVSDAFTSFLPRASCTCIVHQAPFRKLLHPAHLSFHKYMKSGTACPCSLPVGQIRCAAVSVYLFRAGSSRSSAALFTLEVTGRNIPTVAEVDASNSKLIRSLAAAQADGFVSFHGCVDQNSVTWRPWPRQVGFDKIGTGKAPQSDPPCCSAQSAQRALPRLPLASCCFCYRRGRGRRRNGAAILQSEWWNNPEAWPPCGKTTQVHLRKWRIRTSTHRCRTC